MNALQNLSIKVKLAIIILPIVLALIYFTAIVIGENYRTSNDLDQLQTSIRLGAAISNTVHELQRERGQTAGFLTSKGENFSAEIIIRRKATDKRLEEFNAEVERVRASSFAKEIEPFIERQQAAFRELADLREKVDLFSIDANEEIARYSSINDRSIKIIRDMSRKTENKQFFQQVTSYVNFLLAKERSGIERGLMTSIFTRGRFDSKSNYRKFTTMVSEQETLLQNFQINASKEWSDKYKEVLERDELDKDAVNKVEEIRKIALENDTFDIDPVYWFSTATGRVDLLKEVEDFLNKRIVEASTATSAQANTRFIYLTAAVVILGLFVILLLFTIVGKLLNNVSSLAQFSQSVSEGNLSETIDLNTKDEIGKFAGVFNEMVVSIKNTQEELEKEKNEARYMYENTYKQSEVVFENVEQGIFLLDVKFNMSTLYSKAMEDIFKNDKIAGENFIQFMRPRLVARDQDALEMFVKHLFNSDIEEDVVNQLNPVEHVQIFSSDEGGELTSKYIKISFSRVLDTEGEINSILVTVIDETETILLQKEIEESEGKNKQEMDLMLSILKVDPAVLSDYLKTCKQSLGSISHKYETDDKKNFKELISFTYNTIHNLKANAGLIELEALADSFHEIEELLSKLQGKELLGDDFLKILYEINQVNQTIDNMNDLLQRILSVSNKSVAAEESNTNEKFATSLQNGANKISEEMGKKVEFQLDNEPDFIIPDRFRTDLKDILLQLIRNSVVHGIETPEERLKKNKLESGLIKVTMTEKDNQLSVSYFDDGAGLDLNKIMKKALDQGLVNQDQVANYSSRDIARLLFKDGFTTADSVSQHAGRGQGMSLVGRLIKKFQGGMKMNFKKGESFEMSFTFPLSESTADIQSVA